MSKEHLWSKNFVIVFAIDFLLSLGFYTLMVTMSEYAVDQYGASTSEAGLVTGIFIIGLIFGRILIARHLNKIGTKRTLMIGLIFTIITSLFYFVSGSLFFILMIRLLQGISQGVAQTATATVVVQILPISRRGEGIGIFSLSIILSNAIGPFLGFFFVSQLNFEIMFGFCLLLAVVSLVIGLFLTVPSIDEPEHISERGFKLSDYIEYKALPIAVFTLISGFIMSGVVVFISFYTNELQLGKETSLFFIVYASVILISRPLMGRIFDSKGANFVIYPSLILFGGGLLLYSQVHAAWSFLLAGALMGFGNGNFVSGAQALSVKGVPIHRLGLATSTFFNLINMGFGTGPYIIGFLIPLLGYRGLYQFAAVVILIMFILYYFFLGKKEKKLSQERFSTGVQTR
jgi:MFS family permease